MTLLLLLNTSAASHASQASKQSNSSSSPESTTAPVPMASPPPSTSAKIYGSRQYYDYYTKMDPHSRMPNLPKPTYTEEQNQDDGRGPGSKEGKKEEETQGPDVGEGAPADDQVEESADGDAEVVAERGQDEQQE